MRSDMENGATVSSTACPPSAETLQNAPDLASPCSASHENRCFKENMNTNKSETPKLSLEPQQMKRKKKGGGYNLRKSLAWDRAFFTEEGILDPLELSTISDVSCREGDDFGKDRKQDCSSPKLDLSSSHHMTSTSLTSHKFPTHLGGKPGSRFGDCPRPLPSPSLKRPANVVKTAGKELKLPKVHGLNPGFTPTSAARSTILRANRVKHNQIIQPDFGIQRHAEPKSSSKGLKNIKSASRSITLQSVRHSDGNSGKSSLRRYSSISMSSPMVDKAGNSASKMISDNATTPRPETSSEGQRHYSTTFEAPIPQNVHVGGKPTHPLNSIMARPTGLRIPSPSLSFFSQPKPLVYRDLPQRITEPDGFGPQKPGNLRLPDNLRMPKSYSRIPESTISSSKPVISKSECIVSSHASAVESIKPNSEHKIQDLPNKNVIARISHEAELQKIGIEVPSQITSCVPTMDEVLKKGMDGYPETSEAGGSEWTNAGFGSKEDYVIQESEKICAINAPPKEKGTHIHLVLDHGSSQSADALDDRVQNTLTMQSDLRKNCKPDIREDIREPHKENSDPVNDSLVETEKTDPYFRSSHQYADPLKLSASVEVLTDNVPFREALKQNSVFASTIEGCENGINLMPEAGDDIKQPRNSSEVQTKCHNVEMQLEKCLKSNTSERLSPEKPMSCQNSHQIENVENLLFVVQDRKDRDKVTGKRMPISLSPGRRHDCYLGKETIIAELLTSTVSDSVNDSVSSESSISLINAVLDCNDKHQGNANSLSNGTTHESHFPHQDTQRMDIRSSCPLPESRNHQLSQKEGTTHESHFPHQDTQRMDIRSSCPLPESRNHQLSQKGTTHESHFPHQDTQRMDIRSSCPLPERRNHQLSQKGTTHESHFPHQDTQRMDIRSSCPLPESRNHQLSQKGTTHESHFPHEDIQRMDVGSSCPLPESRNHKLSQKDTLGKEAEDMPCIESGSAVNWLISTMPFPLGDNECDINNRGLWDAETLLVQSPESNTLSGCFPNKLLECMEIPSDRFVADNGVHTNNRLQAEGPADDYSEDNALGSTEDSVKGQDQMYLSTSKSPNLSAKESPSNSESCNETVDHTADAITDPSGVKPWSDTIKDEVSENTISSLKCLNPKLDHVIVEAASAPNNKHENGLNEKSRLLVIPQNAAPFSDEWLAAIEAAGEDILTRKSGKVQHSPPDKSVPEPSPWSPVKRKNNQIGPYDCTKFTAPSDSTST